MNFQLSLIGWFCGLMCGFSYDFLMIDRNVCLGICAIMLLARYWEGFNGDCLLGMGKVGIQVLGIVMLSRLSWVGCWLCFLS